MHFMLATALMSVLSTSLAKIFPLVGNKQYSLTYWQAFQKCAEVGASLATPAELVAAIKSGYSHCNCGWLADRSARYPMAEVRRECGGKVGVHRCSWRSTWDAFCFIGDPTGNCSRPLGMENGDIPDLQLTSSTAHHTFWTERWEAHFARLNQQGVVNAWMPHHDGRNQYIEVSLGKPMAISGIITQGAKRYLRKQYVTSFKVAYSKDGDLWIYYSQNGSPKIFTGNKDNNGLVRNMFSNVVFAQYLRVYPYSWVHHISLRFEILGCKLDVYETAVEERGEIDI